MKCLITGIGGFVGPYLADLLAEKGFEVAGTYLLEKPTNLKSKNIKLYKVDILDEKGINEIFMDFVPDYIFHLAGISSVKYSIENPDLTYKINIDGTKNIIGAFESLKNKPTLLIIGSSNEYGAPKEIPIKESHALNPTCPYSKSKLKVEKMGLDSAGNGHNVIVVRSFTHIGPGQTDAFVTSSFAKQIAQIEAGKHEPTIKVGNLESERDFTDVRDVVKAYLLAVQECKPGEPYNICSGKSYKVQFLLDKLLGMSNAKIEIQQDPERIRKEDIPILRGDNTKFRQATGWEPTIKIEKSLEDILNYWRNEINQP